MWDLIVSVNDHCLSFYFTILLYYLALTAKTLIPQLPW